MATTMKRGVFCLEGPWSPKLTHRASMSPLLQLLEDVQGVTYERRDCATAEEVEFYLSKWTQKGYANSHSILLMAFHRSRGEIQLGRGTMSLEDLGASLEGKCKSRYIHFDSCEVLSASKRRVDAFREQTGATVVSGYRCPVGWIDSAAFSLHLLEALATGEPMMDSLRRMAKRNEGTAKRLGFRAIGTRGAYGFA